MKIKNVETRDGVQLKIQASNINVRLIFDLRYFSFQPKILEISEVVRMVQKFPN